MYYKQEDIDKLLDNLKIEEVVGEFIELKKVGSSYKDKIWLSCCLCKEK